MIARVVRVTLLAAGWFLLSGHVGSNTVVLEGLAGGYPVRVVISPPGVVPAQVPIMVRVLQGVPTRVTVQAAQWNLGTKGAPPPEDATLVAGETGVWAHDLWIMTSSTYAVHVSVAGPAGSGALVVPMQSSATQTLGMNGIMTVVLMVLGTLLVLGVLTIVGAAAREGSLPVGAKPTPAHHRRARYALAFAAGLLGLGLLGGAKWWAVEEDAYRRSLFRPVDSASAVREVDGARVLTVAITDSLWHAGRYSPMMPDHGKMMHLFLVRAGDAGAIAHLHPLRVHRDSFTTPVPDLPAGRYLLFADILLQSGAQRTLVDTIDLNAAPAQADVAVAAIAAANTSPGVDADDSWRIVAPVALGDGAALAGGGTLTLRADTSIAAGRDLRLLVAVRNADGTPSLLEPYMGMGGHAMVMRVDGGVFVHLHPMGTASMAAQAQLMRRERGDTVRRDSATLVAESDQSNAQGQGAADPHTVHQMPTASVTTGIDRAGALAFPFAFPGPGEYRVFVQVKRAGTVETASFRVVVPATTPRS